MKEIKYRIWDFHQEKFLSLEDYQKLGAVHVEKDGSIVFKTDYRFLLNTWLQKNVFEPQQYTEVPYKSGAEVVEGDIVCVKYKGYVLKYVIAKKNGAFFLINKKQKNIFLADYVGMLEKLGTKFEDPGLYKEMV